MMPTCFSSLIGNEPIKGYLQRMIDKQAVGNSLLFVGLDGIGKSLFAHVLAAKLLGAVDEKQRQKLEKGLHPDLHIYRPEGKIGLHSIQSLRRLSEEVHLPPYEANWKVFIIHEAERMLVYSANALLKTFEEPPARTLIILLSHAQTALLPTIVSRCRTLHFQPLAQADIERTLSQHDAHLSSHMIQKMASLSEGSLGRALQLASRGEEATYPHLLDVLVKTPMSSYKALCESAKAIAELVESSRKQAEEAAKEEIAKLSKESLSAQQQHGLERELEGFSSLLVMKEMQALFNQLLSWYRDLHLLHVAGGRQFLMNPDYEEVLEQALQRGHLLSMEAVQQAIREAELALQRSVSLSICLENLFLKLKWI